MNESSSQSADASPSLKVSFFVDDLSNNSIARIAPLASSIDQKYDVEVLGLLISGENVHEPYQGAFDYKTVSTTTHASDLFPNILRLAALATGDIVYAGKPLVTSFAPALVAARFYERRPLFLDVEDDDWQKRYGGDKPWWRFVWRDVMKGWRLGTSWKYAAATHALTGQSDRVTVVSRKLQRRYGGTLLHHARDGRAFNPARFDGGQASLRQKRNLPEERKLALFAGVPRSHKGLDTLAEALSRPAAKDWDLVMAGPRENAISQHVEATLGPRCHHLGYLSYDEMPELLATVDAVPLPQKAVVYAESQVPAKVIEALAMARPVVGTRMGELPEILGHGQRGWVVEPECPAALADALGDIATRPKEARRRGRAGREWFMKNASSSATFSMLDTMFAEVSHQNGRRAA